MSTVTTPEYLRDCSVQAVRSYITSQTPLTDSVVSIAQRDKLNPEQIARVVEVVNQVAYLKLLESAKDRTFEFKLADYTHVMEKIMSPNPVSTSSDHDSDSPLNVFKEDVVKSASEDNSREITAAERHTLILREYQRGLGELEKLANEERELVFSLSSQLQTCRADEEILEKVAYLTDGEEDAVADISKMVYGHSKEASYDQAFYEDDLIDARNLVSTFIKAKDVMEKKAQWQDTIGKANDYLKHTAKMGITGARNTYDRAAAGMPGRLSVLMMAPTFQPSNPISGLHKTLPN